MIDFSSLVIIGALVSLITQGIKILQKKYTDLNEYFTIAVALGLSILVATFYYVTKDTAFWETAGQVLVYAGAVYTFLIQRFEKKE
jgi:NADH:ubiquinone oxidoreductase subunit 6 (subunit J)